MEKKSFLRIVFFGTAVFAAKHLYALVNFSGCKITAVFTQRQKISSKEQLFPSLYKITQQYSIPFFESNDLSVFDILSIIKKDIVDLIVVVSYGLILPQAILNIPKLGCINVHGSLLPRWRGPAPIQRALEYGDKITGVTIIQMDAGIDTGNILRTEFCKILPTDTTYTLSNKLASLGSSLLLKVIADLVLGVCKPTVQNTNLVTYAYKICKQEARIHWVFPAIQLDRYIRAFNPWPVSYFYVKNFCIRVWSAEIYNQQQKKFPFLFQCKSETFFNQKLPGTILEVSSNGINVLTGSGILKLTVLQISGKKKLPVRDILNAYKSWFIPGSILN
ncbi:methionyl-tRNA formyltransferase [Candidatus Blochmannia ocreatus (nom. nud.)]|uniref:Methionyl-tRNA formyltransferase n=1 Tax=Candidatus Blochmannia ocreatus (nom. nud.) TaxID=251538 RepID=A0ABY4STJ8_9ENTR|nr:methionyl-tRNA formyltransferase [Candidatus Blochmannia ocreatus]URJ25292.1 methionyl-tRNA formyltransferase [Candidatus Blochmannia ocreatus]